MEYHPKRSFSAQIILLINMLLLTKRDIALAYFIPIMVQKEAKVYLSLLTAVILRPQVIMWQIRRLILMLGH